MLLFSVVLIAPLKGQDDLMNLLDEEVDKEPITEYATSTFKGDQVNQWSFN